MNMSQECLDCCLSLSTCSVTTGVFHVRSPILGKYLRRSILTPKSDKPRIGTFTLGHAPDPKLQLGRLNVGSRLVGNVFTNEHEGFET